MPIKKIIDISWPVTPDMTAYKDKKEVAFKHVATFQQDRYRKSTITLSAHAGTHVDAPSHFVEQGVTIDQVELAQLMGPCVVLDMTQWSEKITAGDLEKHDIKKDAIVLLKTKNSFFSATAPFDPNFVYIDLTAAQYLADKQIKAIGIDYIGIEHHQPGHETHEIFFKNGVAIIEGLRLEDVEQGKYFFCCLPLKVIGLDGTPARAILLVE